MFQQQRKSHVVPPAVASQNENQAKEKLAGYVYEYLMLTGAKQTAEAFKNEIPQASAQVSVGEAPGFLQDWWCVFWDLYSAAPERREKFEPSQEAKAFHEYGFIQSSAYPGPAPLMNGMHGQQFGNGAPPGPMVGMQPGADGMFPAYFPQRGNQAGPSMQSNQASPIPGGRYAHPGPGARSGAPTPSSVMSGGPFPGGQPAPHLFNEQMRMQAAAAAQRNLPQNARIPTGFAPMRHMRPSGMYGPPGQHPQFLHSPAGTPPFPQNPMQMQNGGGMCSAVSLMSSPGPPGSVPTNPDGTPQHDPRFIFGMSQQPHDGSGTPTSSNPTSVNPGMQQQPSADNSFSGAGGGQLQNILNGGNESMEMKQSPASSVHGVNGGTPGHPSSQNPGSIQAGGGPASAAGCHTSHGPGSVHSQTGSMAGPQGPNSHQTPEANIDFQAMGSLGEDSASEISKIKANLINDFQTTSFQ